MAEYMTDQEVKTREDAVDAFMAHVALAESRGDINVSLALEQAAKIRDELERLAEIEKLYDDAMSAGPRC